MDGRTTTIGLASAALATATALVMLWPERTPATKSAVAVRPSGAARVAPPPPTESEQSIDVAPIAAGDPSEERDWLMSLAASEDDFALAQELAAFAVRGDARAQYALGRLLLRCEALKRGLAPYEGRDLAERIENSLAALPNSLERRRQAYRRDVRRCARLFTDDPFAGFELPADASRYRYWSERAYESRDPLAVMERVSRLIVGDGPTQAGFGESLLSEIRDVVVSGDAAALFAVGGVFSHPSVVADPTQGYAWQVAACEMGYECSKVNPMLGGGCAEDGTCVAGETHLDMLRRDLGASRFASIYASAQDIQYKIRSNDWEGLQQYLQVKE